jgi:threonyl-tRNA synthetase
MAPVQAVVLPINDALTPFAEALRGQLEAAGLRCEVDSRSESLNRKVREAQLAYTPLILTAGQREQADGTVSVRTLDGAVRQGVPVAEFIDRAQKKIRLRSTDTDIWNDV